jgi:hypothetical protein
MEDDLKKKIKKFKTTSKNGKKMEGDLIFLVKKTRMTTSKKCKMTSKNNKKK